MLNSFWDQLPRLSDPEPAQSRARKSNSPRTAEARATEGQQQQASVDALQALADARVEAESILENARMEAAQLFEDARQNGFAQGAEDARAAIEEQLTNDFELRRTALQTEVRSVLDIIEAERVAMWNNSEKEVLAFAMDVAKKVLKTEIQQNKNAVIEVIRHALRRVVEKDQVRVRVNPNEIETVRGQRDDLMLVLDGARHLEIVDDRRIEPGGCVVETSAGTIDAKIETQMDQIIQALEIEQ